MRPTTTLRFFFLASLLAASTRRTARRVDRQRFFHEHVLALSDCVLIVYRTEVLRGGKNHQVNAAIDGLLVRLKTDEAALGRHVELRLESPVRLSVVVGLLAPGKIGQAGLEPVFEQIGHRPELHRSLGLQGLRSGPRTTGSATYQRQP